jgi:HAE1 family hydrophobic/amphiphilic exporter-1
VIADITNALKASNSNAPIGQLDGKRQMLMLQITGGLMKTSDFGKVIVAMRNGQAVRLSDLAKAEDSIENVQDTSAINGESSISLNVQRQPGANTVAIVDAVKAMMPRLQAQMPRSAIVKVLNDRSISIRNAVHDVMLTMMLTIALVIMVILLFLRRLAAMFIPSISLPISLLGTFALMYAFGLSLDNISLMGLTVAVGLVVDDAKRAKRGRLE